ncbi:hypothetical protein GE09DRAFT_1216169 [Coniochaeta sp. 2T2.1]|nr:hypothetical protein GE09DRAFT_1216169 [Coniochaeta sp. 2T2.1]
MDSSADHTQYDRDLRGASQEYKRYQDSTHKWRLGAIPLSPVRGVYIDDGRGSVITTVDRPAELGKVRPRHGDHASDPHKDGRNLNKVGRSNHWSSSYRTVIAKTRIADEIDAAAAAGFKDHAGGDPPVSPTAGVGNDPFIYSFDSVVTPGAPLSLDVFVKQPTARDTERLVEKEYEVVDENGLALKGKERKGNLRKTGSGVEEARVEDGFEIV